MKEAIFLNKYYAPPSSAYLRARKEKKGIGFISLVAGCCVVGCAVIQNALLPLLINSPLGEIYQSDPAMRSVVSVFTSVLSVLAPFAIGGAIISKRTRTPFMNAFRKPASASLAITATAFGIFVCLIGNYATSVFVNFMGSVGITLTAPEFDVPSDAGGRIMYAVAIAAVPALVEEFAIRGAILQPLRKYGDRFAIIASALLFAVLHGNLVQAPFALIAGLGIGYAVCVTNSVWTGTLIHFCNNLYSVATEFMIADIPNEEALDAAYSKVTAVLCAVSIIGSVLFVFVKRRRKLAPSFSALSESEKLKAFLFTPAMIVAFIVMLNITAAFVSFQSNLNL